jgi:hypothetical protein
MAWVQAVTYREFMCRSIKVLRRAGDEVEDQEIRAAALQFVRKISGYHRPSRANARAFELAVEEIAAASRRLLEEMTNVSHRGTASSRAAPQP